MYDLQYWSRRGWITIRHGETKAECKTKRQRLIAQNPALFHSQTKWRVVRAT